jgi:hypothetical protein
LRPDAEHVRAILAAAFVDHMGELWPADEAGPTPEWIREHVDSILATLERLYAASGYVAGGAIGQRHHSADAGHRHQAPAHIIMAHDGQQATMKNADLLAKRLHCRVSTQTTGNSASARALNSHCDNGPASNPIRLKG